MSAFHRKLDELNIVDFLARLIARETGEPYTARQHGRILQDISKTVEHAIRVYAALGGVPCEISPKEAGVVKFCDADRFGNYARIIKVGLDSLGILSLPDIARDLVITKDSEGRIRASRLGSMMKKKKNNNKIAVVPLGENLLTSQEVERGSSLLTEYIKSPEHPVHVAGCVALELQRLYARQESALNALDHINESYLIVSTDISDEAKIILNKSHQLLQSMAENAAAAKEAGVSKLAQRIEELVKNASKIPTEIREKVTVMKLDGTGKWQKSLAETLRELRASLQREVEIASTQGFQREFLDILDQVGSMDSGEEAPPLPLDSLSWGGKNTTKKQTQPATPRKSEQEKEILRKLTSCTKLVDKQSTRISQYKTEVINLMEENRRYRGVVEALKTQLEASERQIVELESNIRTGNEAREKLQARFREMTKTIREIVDELNIQQEQRKTIESLNQSLLRTFEEDQGGVEVGENHRILSVLADLMGAKNTAAAHALAETYRYSSLALNQVLSELAVRPLPLFGQENTALTITNQWIPVEAFRDRPVVDSCHNGVPSRERNRPPNRLDINPPGPKDEELLRRILRDLGHSPTRVHQQRYLFGNPKSHAGVCDDMERRVQQEWDQRTSRFFHLSEPLFTKTGQQTLPQFTAKTFETLLGGLIDLCTGQTAEVRAVCQEMADALRRDIVLVAEESPSDVQQQQPEWDASP